MPLDVGDYLKDTGHLTVAEHGAYLLLIMHYWINGGLPADERMIARIARMSPDQWAESRDVIAAMFREGWKHKRIDEEVEKAEGLIAKRRAAANARHHGSTGDADALQVDSTSSDTGVPPSPSPSQDKPAPSVPEAVGARDDFDDLLEVFPRNQKCSESRAEAAWRATKAKDRPTILAAARRYAAWFIEDCADRDRTPDAGKRYSPFLANWIESGDWRKALTLPLKTEAGKPSPDLVVIREDDPDFTAIERLRGKRPVVGKSGTTTVTIAERDRARAEAVH